MMLYPNAVVQEAICSIAFEAPARNDAFSAYFDRIREEYPSFVPVPQQTISLGFGPQGPLPPQQSLTQLMRYTDRDGASVLTLAPDSLSVHVLAPYPGWSQMLQKVQYAWQELTEVVHPGAAIRASLRYINVLECNSETDVLGYWLTANDFIPPAVLSSNPFVPFQVMRNFNDGKDALRVSVAKAIAGHERNGVFIWEMERSQTGNLPIDPSGISNVLAILHTDVRKAFDTAVGSNLQRLMIAAKE
jgi:uncharacterized protein (TIGR04255 family)